VFKKNLEDFADRTQVWTLGKVGGNSSQLATELELLEPVNRFALIGDDLRLPDEGDGHDAHGKDAKDQNEADMGFLNGKPESAAKPHHGKGSPSTRMPQLAHRCTNSGWQGRGTRRLPVKCSAIGKPLQQISRRRAILRKTCDLLRDSARYTLPRK
jgi:hypothetical protein